MVMVEQKEEIELRFPEFSRYGRKFEKAIGVVLGGGVKEARFLPSGRRLFTVVGNIGDEFIDPEKPYCSCSHFFFRVLNGRDETCYHLLSYNIASKTSRVDVTEFSDEEYRSVIGALVRDVLEAIDRS